MGEGQIPIHALFSAWGWQREKISRGRKKTLVFWRVVETFGISHLLWPPFNCSLPLLLQGNSILKLGHFLLENPERLQSYKRSICTLGLLVREEKFLLQTFPTHPPSFVVRTGLTIALRPIPLPPSPRGLWNGRGEEKYFLIRLPRSTDVSETVICHRVTIIAS